MIKAYKNKKILVGICDIGNGHINRQICVINKFLNEGAHVIVATTKEKENIIKDLINGSSLNDIKEKYMRDQEFYQNF